VMFRHAPGYRFGMVEDQIRITGGSGAGGIFSDKGDSGSLVLDALSLQPIGLFFADNGPVSYCNKIHRVMSGLGIPRV
jgi:hypothetical protein